MNLYWIGLNNPNLLLELIEELGGFFRVMLNQQSRSVPRFDFRGALGSIKEGSDSDKQIFQRKKWDRSGTCSRTRVSRKTGGRIEIFGAIGSTRSFTGRRLISCFLFRKKYTCKDS